MLKFQNFSKFTLISTVTLLCISYLPKASATPKSNTESYTIIQMADGEKYYDISKLGQQSRSRLIRNLFKKENNFSIKYENENHYNLYPKKKSCGNIINTVIKIACRLKKSNPLAPNFAIYRNNESLKNPNTLIINVLFNPDAEFIFKLFSKNESNLGSDINKTDLDENITSINEEDLNYSSVE